MVNKRYELKDKTTSLQTHGHYSESVMKGNRNESFQYEDTNSAVNKGFEMDGSITDEPSNKDQSDGGVNGNGVKDVHHTDIEIEVEDAPLFLFDVYDDPNVFLTIGFAMQDYTSRPLWKECCLKYCCEKAKKHIIR